MSEDGSAKCDAFYAENNSDVVIGALFEMDSAERVFLDRAEGLGVGYDEKFVLVQNDKGEKCRALTYIATKIDHCVLPYTWYLDHEVIGAVETALPASYIKAIKATISKVDPDMKREADERKVYL